MWVEALVALTQEGFLGTNTRSRVGAGVERMWGVGPCGRPLGRWSCQLVRHGGQPQGPPPRTTPPLPLRGCHGTIERGRRSGEDGQLEENGGRPEGHPPAPALAL